MSHKNKAHVSCETDYFCGAFLQTFAWTWCTWDMRHSNQAKERKKERKKENTTIISSSETTPTRWNHFHFGVGVVGITQKKVWAAGSPLSERWNKVQAFEESLRRRCGPTAHRSKDSEIECGPSAPTEWTVKSWWNTFFTFHPFLRGSLIVKTALLVVLHYSFETNSSDIAPSTGP